MAIHDLSRRSFLAAAAAAPLALSAQSKNIPVGLELYSVRDELKKDLMGTVRTVAGMGYETVEFYSPYFEWTPDYAKQVRKLLDELKVRAPSTHNSSTSITPQNIGKAIELNGILGSKIVVVASAGKTETLDDWKRFTEALAKASDTLRKSEMRAGFHNHASEWKVLDGKRPIDVIADGTPKDFVLQLDVGTCLEMKQDPVAFIKAHPGRVNSYHLKEWSDDPKVGYKALLGEGVGKWKEIFSAAESVGGAEYYLIEQEGSRFPPFETAKKCLATYRKLHGT